MAETLNRVQPENYIFCSCENQTSDYSRPQKSVFTGLRAGPNPQGRAQLRHQAIRELAEANVPESVMMSMAGH